MLRIIRNRWFLGAFSVLAIALILWFAGDLVAFGESRPLETPAARLWAIAFVVFVWLAIEGTRILLARRANKKLIEGIAGDGAVDESGAKSAAEVATLRQRFEQAASMLKKSKGKGGGGGQALLYQLPWYVFIGAPGSGKTTALVNSGLRFPLAEGEGAQAVKGVGGTRNCDWWFTDEAVLLDTAGRYTTQESEAKVDSAAWLGFLALLKKFRPGQPLNGAIVTLSVSDLLAWNDADREKYAKTIRQRIAELYEQLGVRFPIYVIVTKTDLLAGFSEFFGDLGREDRGQVWGTTFSFKAQAGEGTKFAEQFSEEFRALESRVAARLVERMQQERDVQRRSLVYNFPQQFAVIGPLVTSFIDGVFTASRFDQQPMLRGVYFTSGTQEGTPIDRVLGALSRSFGLERKVLPPSTSSGKSFFLTRLLREVIFPEAGLVSANEKRETLLKWLTRAAFATVAVVTIGLVGGWIYSYVQNKALVAETEKKVAAIREKVEKLPAPRADDLLAVMPVLDELRDLPFGPGQQNREVPWSMRLGLFQGDKIGARAASTYQQILREAFLPRIALRLEELMRTPGNPEALYESLKSYLMLYQDKHLDVASLEGWVAADWERKFPRDTAAAQRKAFGDHLKASLESRPVDMTLPMDKDLVQTVRTSLSSAPLPDRIYARLKALDVGSQIPPFRISDAAGSSASQVFVRPSGAALTTPIPGLLTYDGYHKSFKTESDKVAKQFAQEESWVLGEEMSAARKLVAGVQLNEAVRKRYLEDYMRAWYEMVNDIQLKKSTSLSDTVMFARVLASPADSPLKKLAIAIAKETNLLRADDPARAVTAKVTEAISDTAKKLASRILGDSGAEKLVGDRTRAPEQDVDDRFEPLRRLVTAAGPNQPMPIDQVLTLLNDFYLELNNLDSQIRSGAASVQAIPSAGRLKAEAERMPQPIKAVLLGLVTTTSDEAAKVNTEKVSGGVAGAAQLCTKAIMGRYPVSKASPNDILVGDFEKVFGAGGDLDEYFQKNLAAVVDTTGASWKQKAGTESTVKLSPATITEFQNAATIRDAFFRGGTKSAAAQADLVLVSSDANPVNFEYDGQVQKLAPGSAIRVQWPSQKPGPVARLSVSDTGQKVSGEGNWALFRLFDRGTPEGTGDKIKLTYQIEGKKVVFELRANSINNPFRLRALETFQCPGK